MKRLFIAMALVLVFAYAAFVFDEGSDLIQVCSPDNAQICPAEGSD